MIIVRLQGGLGNQLFQYALGKTLATVSGQKVKYDATSYGTDELRKVEILDFNVQVEFASRIEISQLRYGIGRHLIGKMIKRAPRPREAYRKESSQRFDPLITTLKGNAYLDGYWQSERYFETVGSSLRKELKLKQEITGESLEFSKRLSGCESVSIHVRRGDYLSMPLNQGIYHSCDIGYYRKSVECLANELKDARFFVFSDDPEWVKANLLPILGPTATCLPVSKGPAQDLTLMSLCRHHIIANSSFSWWGAWLNPRPDKIVMAPMKWFNDTQIVDADMIPSSWRRLF